MVKTTLTHDLACSPDRFWELFFDRTFSEAMFKQGLGFPEWTILEDEDGPAERHRVVKATPKMDAPAAVVKILGSSFGYTEDGRFDKATKTFRFVIKASTMADKLRHDGTLRCEPAGEGRSKRVVSIEAEAKIFGVGGMIETALEKTIRGGWDKSAVYMNDWVKAHP